MSRSFRKFAVSKDGERRIKKRFREKTLANRAVRRFGHIPSGKGGFRKIYDSWFISDWRVVAESDEKEVLRRNESERKNVRLAEYADAPEDAVREWKKYYKNK